MRNMVKLGFIASVLLLICCSNDFPPAPEMKFCKFTLENNETLCKSIHLVSKSDCDEFHGEIVTTCEEPETTGTE